MPPVAPSAGAQTTDTTTPVGAAPTAMAIASRIPVESVSDFLGSLGTVSDFRPWTDYSSPSPCTGSDSESTAAIPIAASPHRLSGAVQGFAIEGAPLPFDGTGTYPGCAFVEVYDSPDARLAAEKEFALPSDWVEGSSVHVRFADCGPVLVRLATKGGADGVDSRIAAAQDALDATIGNCPTAEFSAAVVAPPRSAKTHSESTSIVVYLVAGAVLALIIVRFVVAARRHQLRTD
jgi:hypothetical protein